MIPSVAANESWNERLLIIGGYQASIRTAATVSEVRLSAFRPTCFARQESESITAARTIEGDAPVNSAKPQESSTTASRRTPGGILSAPNNSSASDAATIKCIPETATTCESPAPRSARDVSSEMPERSPVRSAASTPPVSSGSCDTARV